MASLDLNNLETIIIEGSGSPLAAELIELERDTLGAGAFDHMTWPVLLDHGLVCALKRGSEIIALIAFIKDWRENGKAYLATIVVKRKWQHQGVGTFLLEQALERLQGNGITKVRLTVDPGNEAGCNLYKKTGFFEIGFQPEKYGPGYDRLVLERTLSA